MQDIKLKYSRAVLLLTEFIESFVEQNPELLQQQSDMFLDIDSIKEAENVSEVGDETLVALCLVLLKQLQPYITDLQDSKHTVNYERRYNDPKGDDYEESEMNEDIIDRQPYTDVDHNQ